MNALLDPSPAAVAASPLSAEARRRFATREGAPWLLGDWLEAVFFHYAIAPTVLQPFVPFALDQFEGRAFVSLVAFTMRRMRFARGGMCSAWLCQPVREQRFLNLRTYVRHGNETGILFLHEWISHWLCVQLGPLLYGLPYQWARLDYDAAPVEGHVEPRHGTGRFAWRIERPARLGPVEPSSLDEFLLERYTAFTARRARHRFFRIWHEPWPQARVEVARVDESLSAGAVSWWNEARFQCAHYSPGVRDIWMGWPRGFR